MTDHHHEFSLAYRRLLDGELVLHNNLDDLLFISERVILNSAPSLRDLCFHQIKRITTSVLSDYFAVRVLKQSSPNRKNQDDIQFGKFLNALSIDHWHCYAYRMCLDIISDVSLWLHRHSQPLATEASYDIWMTSPFVPHMMKCVLGYVNTKECDISALLLSLQNSPADLWFFIVLAQGSDKFLQQFLRLSLKQYGSHLSQAAMPNAVVQILTYFGVRGDPLITKFGQTLINIIVTSKDAAVDTSAVNCIPFALFLCSKRQQKVLCTSVCKVFLDLCDKDCLLEAHSLLSTFASAHPNEVAKWQPTLLNIILQSDFAVDAFLKLLSYSKLHFLAKETSAVKRMILECATDIFTMLLDHVSMENGGIGDYLLFELSENDKALQTIWDDFEEAAVDCQHAFFKNIVCAIRLVCLRTNISVKRLLRYIMFERRMSNVAAMFIVHQIVPILAARGARPSFELAAAVVALDDDCSHSLEPVSDIKEPIMLNNLELVLASERELVEKLQTSAQFCAVVVNDETETSDGAPLTNYYSSTSLSAALVLDRFNVCRQLEQLCEAGADFRNVPLILKILVECISRDDAVVDDLSILIGNGSEDFKLAKQLTTTFSYVISSQRTRSEYQREIEFRIAKLCCLFVASSRLRNGESEVVCFADTFYVHFCRKFLTSRVAREAGAATDKDIDFPPFPNKSNANTFQSLKVGPKMTKMAFPVGNLEDEVLLCESEMKTSGVNLALIIVECALMRWSSGDSITRLLNADSIDDILALLSSVDKASEISITFADHFLSTVVLAYLQDGCDAQTPVMSSVELSPGNDWPRLDVVLREIEQNVAHYRRFRAAAAFLVPALRLVAGAQPRAFAAKSAHVLCRALAHCAKSASTSMSQLAGAAGDGLFDVACDLLNVMAAAALLPAPLNIVSELAPALRPYSLYVLLSYVWTYVETNRPLNLVNVSATGGGGGRTRLRADDQIIALVVALVHQDAVAQSTPASTRTTLQNLLIRFSAYSFNQENVKPRIWDKFLPQTP